MKINLNPNYSYEFNVILNETYNEEDQVKNYVSLLSDKDRFLILLPLLEKNINLIEDRLGFKLIENIEFYVVRAEKFKSFSMPITIEYSILPEEMILFLLKEILKISITIRFPDEIIREQYINSFIDYICVNGDFGKVDIIKFGKNLHDESKRLFPIYEFKEINFSSKTMNEYLEEMYNN